MKTATTLFSLGLLILALTSAACADHIYVSGNVFGTWSADTVFVQANINVPANQSLTIQPGVLVLFQGHYSFHVWADAILQANGTEQDSVTFTASDTTTGFLGIRFYNANITSYLHYCSISYGKAYGTGEDNNGGGIYCNACGPQIQNCRIANCSATYNGGGIYCINSGPNILNNTIMSNSVFNGSPAHGGGVYCEYSNANITGNIIKGNSAVGVPGSAWGGGICVKDCSPAIVNNLIEGNYISGVDGFGGGIYLHRDC
jgi:parallel beta-helix repeat protein